MVAGAAVVRTALARFRQSQFRRLSSRAQARAKQRGPALSLGRFPAKSPGLAALVQVTGAAAWAEVVNGSFRTSQDLNDPFKTFASGCGGRGGPCRGGGDTRPGFAGSGVANESWGASGVPNESFATFGPGARTS